MAKGKYWNGTSWQVLDAGDADTLDGKHFTDIKNEIEIKYATASGTNTYTVTISGITAYTEGLSVKIKFTNANTGASTLNINSLGAKSIVKSNGNALSSGNIKAGQICHLVYTGSVFQLLGEGGEYGTAQPNHVLEGYTIGTETGLVNGTIPSKGAATITPSTADQTIDSGQYLSGVQTIAGDANLISSNIKSGVSIFGVAGNSNVVDTSAGDATASEILTGKKAYVGGALIIGTLKAFQYANLTTTITISYPSDDTYYSTNFSITGLPFNPRQIYASIKGNYGSNAVGGMMAYGDYITFSDQSNGYPELSFDSIVFGTGSISGRVRAVTRGSAGGSTTIKIRLALP